MKTATLVLVLFYFEKQLLPIRFTLMGTDIKCMLV